MLLQKTKKGVTVTQKQTFSASIQAKNGRLYAVIQADKNGKKFPVWRTLGLNENESKPKINKKFREVVNKYEEEYAQEIEMQNKPKSDIPVYEYMTDFLNRTEHTLQKNTRISYRSMLEGRIKRFFTEHSDLTVGNLKPADIMKFYDTMVEDKLTGNSIIHYHALLRKGFNQAFKEEMIDSNPFDRIDRPKKNKFHGDYFSAQELQTLLKLSKGDVIYPAIMLAGGLGLRRSEALGVRWSRIDWKKKTVLLDTKITEFNENGHKSLEAVEEMKNKSSHRTLPLPEPVYEMLCEEKTKQEINKRRFKGSYSREFADYVCVDGLGNMIPPSTVTRRFGEILRQYGLRHIRFHDLRHTFASLLISKEVPLINVSNFLGHSDLSTTANIYAHLDKSSKQISADIMGEIINGTSD